MKIDISDNYIQENIDIFGRDYLLLTTVEELSELQKEILKNINRGKENRDALVEEASDVLCMVKQLMYIYGIEDDVKKYMTEKLEKWAVKRAAKKSSSPQPISPSSSQPPSPSSSRINSSPSPLRQSRRSFSEGGRGEGRVGVQKPPNI